eukprot:TRINITY_DN28913_c0_g1_i1.p1 TRINITY_DN28913_c0_g1~~TRINITY_DN28913_c0_g1_i1.p1  ORF type:complete len:238 (+),score=63.26 TRINITY_DN28913_c0_g1_i1:80-715(+)
MAAALAQVLAAPDAGPNAVVFVRHGKTNKADTRLYGGDEDRADLARTLTDAGKEGCTAAKEKWFGALGVCGTVSSVAGRCLDTARLMGAPEPAAQAASIYEGTCIPANSGWFAKLGYAPLRAYHDAGATADFTSYAESVLSEVAPLLAGMPAGGVAAVFGHAVYSSACALALVDALGGSQKDRDAVLGFTQGETDGILVSQGGGVRICTAG